MRHRISPDKLCHMSTPLPEITGIQFPAEGKYRIVPGRSTVSFTTSHLFGLGKVRGSFRIEDGSIHVADPIGGSSARATIAAASVDTGNSTRDSMLRSPTYLDATAHPHITFASDRLEESEGTLLLHGTLTVRESTAPVQLRVDSSEADATTVRLSASCRIDRYAFAITAMKAMTGRWQTMLLDVTAERD